MSRTKITIACSVLLFTGLLSCSKHADEGMVSQINLDLQAKPVGLSKLVHVNGATVLDPGSEVAFRGIHKLLFAEGKVIVLDNETDFYDIYVFDAQSGRFLNKVGRQTESPDPREGHNGLMDVCYNPLDRSLRVLSAGQKAFIDYSLDGQYIKSFPSGQFGADLEVFDDGSFVVYNEFNSTEHTGLNHLVFYDKEGNITKQMLPYPEQMEGRSYAVTGTLRRQGDKVWLNPAFSDDIYEVGYQQLVPRFEMNLGAKSLPSDLRDQQLKGEALLNYAYLTEGFFNDGPFSLFTVVHDNKYHNTIFDERTNSTLACRASDEQDPLYGLFRVGRIWEKGASEFALYLWPAQAKFLIENNGVEKSALDALAPGLYEKMVQAVETNSPILVYCAFDSNATLQGFE